MNIAKKKRRVGSVGGRAYTGRDVFDESLNRMIELYRGGHRVVVSFSAGKDSGVCLELAIMAAAETGRLPVEVLMRDEEIMYPGTFEYAERVACREEVDFHWIYACQPIINVFDRARPYWWVFDPQLSPDRWVRRPPERAYKIEEQDIQRMITTDRFPAREGKMLIAVIGLRVSESSIRRMSVFSSGGHMTGANKYGTYHCRPIYDWLDGDVYRVHRELGWDINSAYTAMFRNGARSSQLRIAPPTMNLHGVPGLAVARRCWPEWFERVCNRLPGARSVALYGTRACRPARRHGETWEGCFRRTCLDDAPGWIKERAGKVMNSYLSGHARHATVPFPDNRHCYRCSGAVGSWRHLAMYLYGGDPFSMKFGGLIPYVEPEFFREGAGRWGGKPTW